MGMEFDGTAPVTIPGVGAVIGSEFAEVAVSIDDQANAPRLKVEDLRTGRVRYLDALELETIVWLPDERLNSLLDPSADRWRGDE
ncbi:hypothetical protein [Mycobacterium sp. GA-2829]|uniref:hypothetical protein n=1 Tax=Mycobacterium sp. GA-2829 TaxID=1772283 RepID=UPI00073FD289|nr:hypothetical protein [Mycobacterium sp. GA-2829]KUI34222.1 hypothetical protein AU194_17905 [Mycobacterium sp. GA-2829]